MSNEQIIANTQQLILLSAFLGGFSATFLGAILVLDSKRAIANWVVVLSATSACSFVVCAITSVALVNNLQVSQEDLTAGIEILNKLCKIINRASMTIGVFSLLASIGTSGWLRNKNTGIITSSMATISIVIVWVML